jgi:glycosyltransferase involved in cell wall biosynthesis
MLGIASGFLKRVFLLFSMSKYDYVYIHREATPVGPPFIEWMIAKLLRKKIIFDFDDAIWIEISSDANPFSSYFKCSWKVKYICKFSHIVTVGNHYLADYAKQYCKDVRIIPTVVDTNLLHNRLKNQNDTSITIGWTGTFTNLLNLELVLGALKNLKKNYQFIFLIIANKDPEFKDIDYQYIDWNINTEIDDLLKINIGLMPLIATDFQLGKCAFKAIQYMSLGIPSVVSPVGANCEVVIDGENGFWANSENEWIEKLELLINNKSLREEMGRKSRQKVIETYSVEATQNMFYQLFK